MPVCAQKEGTSHPNTVVLSSLQEWRSETPLPAGYSGIRDAAKGGLRVSNRSAVRHISCCHVDHISSGASSQVKYK